MIFKNTVKQFNDYKTQIHEIKEGLDLLFEMIFNPLIILKK